MARRLPLATFFVNALSQDQSVSKRLASEVDESATQVEDSDFIRQRVLTTSCPEVDQTEAV